MHAPFIHKYTCTHVNPQQLLNSICNPPLDDIHLLYTHIRIHARLRQLLNSICNPPLDDLHLPNGRNDVIKRILSTFQEIANSNRMSKWGNVCMYMCVPMYMYVHSILRIFSYVKAFDKKSKQNRDCAWWTLIVSIYEHIMNILSLNLRIDHEHSESEQHAPGIMSLWKVHEILDIFSILHAFFCTFRSLQKPAYTTQSPSTSLSCLAYLLSVYLLIFRIHDTHAFAWFIPHMHFLGWWTYTHLSFRVFVYAQLGQRSSGSGDPRVQQKQRPAVRSLSKSSSQSHADDQNCSKVCTHACICMFMCLYAYMHVSIRVKISLLNLFSISCGQSRLPWCLYPCMCMCTSMSMSIFMCRYVYVNSCMCLCLCLRYVRVYNNKDQQ